MNTSDSSHQTQTVKEDCLTRTKTKSLSILHPMSDRIKNIGPLDYDYGGFLNGITGQIKRLESVRAPAYIPKRPKLREDTVGCVPISNTSVQSLNLMSCHFPVGHERTCKICKQISNSSNIVSCLQNFSELCIDKSLFNEADNSSKCDDFIEGSPRKQESKVGISRKASVACDCISTNFIGFSAKKTDAVASTSCKTNETDISHCIQRANFLSIGHKEVDKWMRCLKNHKLVMLEDTRKTIDNVNKPFYCSAHSTKNLKYFCSNCQIPVCAACLEDDPMHSGHHFTLIPIAGKFVRDEFKRFLDHTIYQVNDCISSAEKLNSAIIEFQSRHVIARELIENNYQNVKAIMVKLRDDSLRELDNLRSDHEMKIKDMLHNFKKLIPNLENACKFIDHLPAHRNCADVLSAIQFITPQLGNLLKIVPTADSNSPLKFDTNVKKFEQLLETSLANFCVEHSLPDPHVPEPQNVSRATQNEPDAKNSPTVSSPILLTATMDAAFGSEFILPIAIEADSPVSAQKIIPDKKINLSNAGATVSSKLMRDVRGASLKIPGSAKYDLQISSSAAKEGLCNLETDVIPSVEPPEDTLAKEYERNTLANIKRFWPKNYTIDHSVNTFLNMIQHDNNVLSSEGSSSDSHTKQAPLKYRPTYLHCRWRNISEKNTKPMQVINLFGIRGNGQGQFNLPNGFCLGINEEIIVADTFNHRIQVFDKDGIFLFQFGLPGKEKGLLCFPRKVSAMPNGKLVVCDRGRERTRIQLFSKCGQFLNRIESRYIETLAGLAITAKGEIVAVDSASLKLFIIAENGVLINYFTCSNFLRAPSDVISRGNQFYVCDFKGHCVVVFKDDGTFQMCIGHPDLTSYPNGIDISNAGDIFIGDSNFNRFHVSVYSPDGELQSEFECPNFHVSRCVGLKITSEGSIVTLAQKNHCVLMLDLLGN